MKLSTQYLSISVLNLVTSTIWGVVATLELGEGEVTWSLVYLGLAILFLVVGLMNLNLVRLHRELES